MIGCDEEPRIRGVWAFAFTRPRGFWCERRGSTVVDVISTLMYRLEEIASQQWLRMIYLYSSILTLSVCPLSRSRPVPIGQLLQALRVAARIYCSSHPWKILSTWATVWRTLPHQVAVSSPCTKRPYSVMYPHTKPPVRRHRLRMQS